MNLANQPSPEPPRTFRACLADLNAQAFTLTKSLARLLETDEPSDSKRLCLLLAGQAEVADLKIALLVRWIELLSHRFVDLDGRAGRTSHRVEDIEHSLDTLLDALKEFDDPYGFGASLDDRLADSEDN